LILPTLLTAATSPPHPGRCAPGQVLRTPRHAAAAQANQNFISFLRCSASNGLRWFVKIISDHFLNHLRRFFKSSKTFF
jgi:hypothetical protein